MLPLGPFMDLGSNADILIKLLPLPPWRAQMSPLCAGNWCLAKCHCSGTHNLHLARGPTAVGGGEDGRAALTVPGPLSICQNAAH